MKKEVLLVLILLSLLSVSPMISAEMYISSFDKAYNVGDSFNFTLTLMPQANTNDFLLANIICKADDVTNSAEIYKVPLNLESSNQQTVQIAGKFDNFLVGELLGTCHIEASYGKESATSSSFELLRSIYVNILTDKAIFEPNDRFDVSIKAIKASGKPVSKGFIELRIAGLGITSFKEIKENYTAILSIPNDAPAGSYEIRAKVYEKDADGRITNNGEASTPIVVKQIIRKREIAISSQSIMPENEFVYNVLLYDQSNQQVSENAELSMFKPNGEILFNKVVRSGVANNITISGDFMPGDWLIISKVGDYLINRSFSVEEFEKASFNLSDNILTVSNIGNVLYDNPIEINIGYTSTVVDVNVDIGEIKRYSLSAPDGEYEVGINEGGNREFLGTSFLTGNAVKVSEEGTGFWKKSYIFIWVMLISAAALFAIQRYRKVSNIPFYAKTPDKYPAPIRINKTSNNANNIISEGKREECAVISLKIKNSDELKKSNGEALNTLERAITRARDARAKIYMDKDYRTIIFAPSLTNEKDNSMKAVAIAKEIESSLNEHNRRFGEKIAFGLGVSNGEMIVESRNGEFNFSSIGNIIPSAKKISDISSAGTAVSEFVHRRILGKVKSDKIEGTNYWRIRKVMDRELHSEFISRFISRQKEDARRR